ncbi:hypothetical protein [Acinetobacter oleivorans]|uniref:hypothetical protein n=1 Tax=Acinetobacter oleivorans TaxID=1148157 RepID=UPI0012501000|nr:hypothetical protein [Acinetobacter oleivorans]
MSLAYVAVGAAVLSAAISGYSAYSTNKTQQEQAQADADASKASGRLEAERIRKQKNKIQSAARAQAAENGLSVNEGTTVTINDKIEQDAQYDAAMSEISGYNASQRLRAEASIYKSNANTAAATGLLNTVSTGASGLYKGGSGSGSKGGWK